jgi:hypothetical protein
MFRYLMQATTDGPVDFESLLHRKDATTAFWDYLDLYERISGYHTTRPESTTADSRKIKVTQLPIDLAAMPHSAPAFIGTKTRPQKVPPIKELLREGYQLIEYDGYVQFIKYAGRNLIKATAASESARMSKIVWSLL